MLILLLLAGVLGLWWCSKPYWFGARFSKSTLDSLCHFSFFVNSKFLMFFCSKFWRKLTNFAVGRGGGLPNCEQVHEEAGEPLKGEAGHLWSSFSRDSQTRLWTPPPRTSGSLAGLGWCAASPLSGSIRRKYMKRKKLKLGKHNCICSSFQCSPRRKSKELCLKLRRLMNNWKIMRKVISKLFWTYLLQSLAVLPGHLIQGGGGVPK